LTDLSKTPHRIAGMFDAIADRYDFLNHLLSAGIDRRWRKRAIQSLALTGRERVLDVCTGTADLAIEALQTHPRAARVIGVDFAAAMLRIGQTKIAGAQLADRAGLIRADATLLPIEDGSVDAVTIAFGIRNVENMGAACREMWRVLKPEGRLAVLEFAIPTSSAMRSLYLWYFKRVLPRIGRFFSRDQAAYTYLPASVSAFPSPDEFVKILGDHGFTHVSAVPLTFGIVYLYTAQRNW
jgi:demethylmenaquinone methyltransferase/2-methoxy-6-polyprenyl-1,4-benzoquinol methylase